MHNNIPIKLKAAFLLTVFALNTVVGFACAAGLNMGFNSEHHHHEREGQKEQTNAGHHHRHEIAGSNHHDENNTSDEDGCCNDSVIKLLQVDKNTSPNTGIVVNTLNVAIIYNFFYINRPHPVNQPLQKLAIPNFHSPPDIRILIQSFQI